MHSRPKLLISRSRSSNRRNEALGGTVEKPSLANAMANVAGLAITSQEEDRRNAHQNLSGCLRNPSLLSSTSHVNGMVQLGGTVKRKLVESAMVCTVATSLSHATAGHVKRPRPMTRTTARR